MKRFIRFSVIAAMLFGTAAFAVTHSQVYQRLYVADTTNAISRPGFIDSVCWTFPQLVDKAEFTIYQSTTPDSMLFIFHRGIPGDSDSLFYRPGKKIWVADHWLNADSAATYTATVEFGTFKAVSILRPAIGDSCMVNGTFFSYGDKARR